MGRNYYQSPLAAKAAKIGREERKEEQTRQLRLTSFADFLRSLRFIASLSLAMTCRKIAIACLRPPNSPVCALSLWTCAIRSTSVRPPGP